MQPLCPVSFPPSTWGLRPYRLKEGREGTGLLWVSQRYPHLEPPGAPTWQAPKCPHLSWRKSMLSSGVGGDMSAGCKLVVRGWAPPTHPDPGSWGLECQLCHALPQTVLSSSSAAQAPPGHLHRIPPLLPCPPHPMTCLGKSVYDTDLPHRGQRGSHKLFMIRNKDYNIENNLLPGMPIPHMLRVCPETRGSSNTGGPCYIKGSPALRLSTQETSKVSLGEHDFR